jgi:hypothetical protein
VLLLLEIHHYFGLSGVNEQQFFEQNHFFNDAPDCPYYDSESSWTIVQTKINGALTIVVFQQERIALREL